ncbi:vWA domain-containing protein [Vallicoccus soli]|uniref:VWA domain-containing protein n=1 Tax=Vallicoccus soli TaxID=2339232 RepID=A0A3A3Z226_9ACTN|nr:VWA domain-containing protein [Vallicoccus soli]RJK96729.1 VWA domain-containing protein [Vallicoccus soli]
MSAVEGLARLAACARREGVAASTDRVEALLRCADALGPAGREDVYWAGRVALCGGPDDLPRYDRAFARFLGADPAGAAAGPPVVVDRPVAAADGAGTEGDGARRTLADVREVLRGRDLGALDALGEDEREAVRRLVALLRPVGALRPSRRRRPAPHGEVDRRRTVRDALRHGGEVVALRHRRRVRRPRPLLVVVDVSGSMQPYADAYLRLAHAAARARPGTEVFTIGTRLTRVTREVAHPDPDEALRAVAAAVPDWSGGTRLGEQLAALLERWGRAGAARGAVAVVLSDAWERGDCALLGEQLERLGRLAHRVVWVDPHEGKPGYAPLTAGMRTVLPRVDAVVSGWTLEALERLCAVLAAPQHGTARRA